MSTLFSNNHNKTKRKNLLKKSFLKKKKKFFLNLKNITASLYGCGLFSLPTIFCFLSYFMWHVFKLCCVCAPVYHWWMTMIPHVKHILKEEVISYASLVTLLTSSASAHASCICFSWHRQLIVVGVRPALSLAFSAFCFFSSLMAESLFKTNVNFTLSFSINILKILKTL